MNVEHLLDKNTILFTVAMGFTVKLIVFVLGFLTVRMGYSLIRDGVKGHFTFTTEAKGMKGALQSSSPGLLFVVLGVFIMCFSMFQHKGVQLFEDALKGGQEVIQQHEAASDNEPIEGENVEQGQLSTDEQVQEVPDEHPE